MRYYHRILETTLKSFLTLFPVLGLTGPRQSGKSTLLRHLLKDYVYVTFDDPQHQAFLQEDPKKFIQVYNHHVIFDEVQKAPSLFPLIKMAVDEDRQNYGRFILTGSSQFSLVQSITESLAGRIGLLSLLPFQYAEIPAEKREASIYGGSYPELILRNYEGAQAWYGSYLETYLHRDVRNLAHVGDLADFQKLIRLLAAHVSQQLNLSNLAVEIGVSVQTVRRWISILEASYIVFLLPPYYENKSKRLSKRPKVYFWDTGLVAYLLGIQTKQQYQSGPIAGSLFENFVISDIAKNEKHRNSNATLYYWRTQHGAEVDLVIDYRSYREWIEIKTTATFHPKLTRHILNCKQAEDSATLIYQGDTYPYTDASILNYKEYLLKESKS